MQRIRSKAASPLRRDPAPTRDNDSSGTEQAEPSSRTMHPSNATVRRRSPAPFVPRAVSRSWRPPARLGWYGSHRPGCWASDRRTGYALPTMSPRCSSIGEAQTNGRRYPSLPFQANKYRNTAPSDTDPAGRFGKAGRRQATTPGHGLVAGQLCCPGLLAHKCTGQS